MPNGPEKPELSSRLRKTTQELQDLKHSVKTGMINVKVLMEFRNAAERARQASAAVQQWLDAQGKGNDPYKLMAQVTSQRLEMATELLRDIHHDLESGDVAFDTPSLPEFGRTVQMLSECMARLFPR
jgi:exonuclease VII small subunit